MNPDWIDQARRLFDALRAGPAPTAADDAHAAGGHPPDCRWCPVCQVAAVVRGERPEVTAALADVLAATATALRTFAGDPAPRESGSEATESDDPDTDAPDTDDPPTVQRIEIA